MNKLPFKHPEEAGIHADWAEDGNTIEHYKDWWQTWVKTLKPNIDYILYQMTFKKMFCRKRPTKNFIPVVVNLLNHLKAQLLQQYTIHATQYIETANYLEITLPSLIRITNNWDIIAKQAEITKKEAKIQNYKKHFGDKNV